MATLDVRMRAKALSLVSKYGKAVTITATETTGDPDTGTVTKVETPYSVKATPPAKFRQDLVDGEAIRESDLEIVLAASAITFTPAQGMKATIDGASYGVVRVTPTFSGELPAIYSLQLRSA